MEENNNKGATNPNEKEEVINQEDFEEGNGKATGTDKPGDNQENKQSQTGSEEKSAEETEEERKRKAQDSHFAKLRREQEAREKAAKEKAEKELREKEIADDAAIKAQLEILKVNKFTNKPIKDKEDLEIYKLQLKLEEEGKNPTEDLPEAIAERNRQLAQAAQQQKEQAAANQKKLDEEIDALIKKYPNLNTAELARDPLFIEAATGRVGRMTQLEIYELVYLPKKAEAEKAAAAAKEEEEVDENGQRIAKVPGSSGKGGNNPKTLKDAKTPEEYEKLWREKYGG